MLAAALPALLLPAVADGPSAPERSHAGKVVNPQELALMQRRMRATPPPPTHLAWPAPDPVTSEFGPRWGRLHTGLDIDGHTGDPVTAAAGGRVVAAEHDGAYGLTVVIRHAAPFADLSTAYAHLSASTVAPGDRVVRGQRIGAIGTTGNAVGDHLHFEVRRGDEALDPRAHLAPERSGGVPEG